MKWHAWHEPHGDTCFGLYPTHERDWQFTIQHQRDWHINVDIGTPWFDRRFTIVTNWAFDRQMKRHHPHLRRRA